MTKLPKGKRGWEGKTLVQALSPGPPMFLVRPVLDNRVTRMLEKVSKNIQPTEDAHQQ